MSQALYSVFVKPALRNFAVSSSPRYYQKRPRFPSSIIRSAASYPIQKPPVAEEASSTRASEKLVNDQIQSRYINLVDEHGVFHHFVPLAGALEKLDRSKHQLVQVAEAGLSDNQVPTCKILSRTLGTAGGQMQVKVPNLSSSKQVEMNWVIDSPDLAFRTKQIIDFLEDGRRVNVVIMPKRRGRRATPHEALAVFEKVKEAVSSVEGAVEAKAMEGQIGKVVNLSFESSVKRSQRRIEAVEELKKKLTEKKKRLEDPDFEKKVLEKRLKFEARKAEKERLARTRPGRYPFKRDGESRRHQSSNGERSHAMSLM